MTTWRRLKSESGAMRPIQYLLIVVGLAIVYGLVIYTPSLLDQMSMSSLADEMAAKMNVNTNDELIVKDIVKRANDSGVHINPANVKLERKQDPIENIVTITWNVEVDHLWGSHQTLTKKVVAKAHFGETKK